MSEFLAASAHLDPVAIVRTGGYIGVAAFVFAESGLLIGIFLPGDSLLFAAGLLAAGGFLAPLPLVLLVVGAAIIGDSTGYWIGAKAGSALFARPDSRFFKQEYVVRARQFFGAYGGRAIVFARFVPVVRTLTPMLAGIGAMRYSRFLAYNLFGGLLWGAGVVLLGYFLGSLIPDSQNYILPLTLIVIALSLAPMTLQFIRHS